MKEVNFEEEISHQFIIIIKTSPFLHQPLLIWLVPSLYFIPGNWGPYLFTTMGCKFELGPYCDAYRFCIDFINAIIWILVSACQIQLMELHMFALMAVCFILWRKMVLMSNFSHHSKESKCWFASWKLFVWNLLQVKQNRIAFEGSWFQPPWSYVLSIGTDLVTNYAEKDIQGEIELSKHL